METRRLGRTNHQTSVLVYGAAALGNVDQDTADTSIQQALDAGINHFDTAASYGAAEQRMGPWMPRIRDQIFLATKTELRSYDDAWRQINESLEKLQTDHVDLIQVHAVNNATELEKVFASGGSLAAVARAKEEGLATWVGITGHTEEAPVVHAEALRRYDFDSVLTPLNRTLYANPEFATAYDALAALVVERDVALRVIKSAARRVWQDGEKDMSTWYKPFTEQHHITAALTWVLDGHPEVCGIATAGEVRLLARMIQAEQERAGLGVAEAQAVLDEVEDYASPFVNS